MTAELVYGLCAVTCVLCAGLLGRGYLRSRARLLLWSSLCFLVLTVNNVLLVVDNVLFVEDVDLYDIRLVTAAVAAALLVYGLIWDAE